MDHIRKTEDRYNLFEITESGCDQVTDDPIETRRVVLPLSDGESVNQLRTMLVDESIIVGTPGECKQDEEHWSVKIPRSSRLYKNEAGVVNSNDDPSEVEGRREELLKKAITAAGKLGLVLSINNDDLEESMVFVDFTKPDEPYLFLNPSIDQYLEPQEQ